MSITRCARGCPIKAPQTANAAGGGFDHGAGADGGIPRVAPGEVDRSAGTAAAATEWQAAETLAARDNSIFYPANGGDRVLRLIADAPVPRDQQRALGLGYRAPSNRADLESDGAIDAFAATDPAAGAVATAAPGTHGAPLPRYSDLRVIGQLFAGYIVLEDSSALADDGLILVDQHAAHERVTFERLKTEMRAGGVRTQALLTPATLELGLARAAQIMANLAELRAIGFEIEPFGPATLLLKAAPAVFGAHGDALKLLNDVIDGMGEGGGHLRGESAFEDLLKRLACHGSVRVGRLLAPDEITALLAALDATPFKSNCPHGRPVHIRFARGSIERLFRR